MGEVSEAFEKNYQGYCARLATVDFASVHDRLGVDLQGDGVSVPLLGQRYAVSGRGIRDASGRRPAYLVSVVLAQYVLLCPERPHGDTEWVAFRDFKRVSHFTNVKIFTSETERCIERNFSCRVGALRGACEGLGGVAWEGGGCYDLSMRVDALPQVALLVRFNDGDEEFPARCTVLFQERAEWYLDPECLAIVGSLLARSLAAGDFPFTRGR